MPEGEILSYDPEEQTGFIEPDDDGDPIPFSLDAVRDHHSGEPLSQGEVVVYEVDDIDEVATSVRRVSPGGYR